MALREPSAPGVYSGVWPLFSGSLGLAGVGSGTWEVPY